jgi:hypothetical protein
MATIKAFLKYPKLEKSPIILVISDSAVLGIPVGGAECNRKAK